MIMLILLVSISLVVGFFGGVACYAAVATRRAIAIRLKLIKEAEGRSLVPRFQTGIAKAAQCWCDPRTSHIEMDTDLAMVFAETITEYIEALQWCSGLEDFQPEGEAWIGFERVCRPLMEADQQLPHIDLTRLTVDQYRKLREDAPDLLGLKG